MRISGWSSDVCSSDLVAIAEARDNDAVKSIIITGTGGAFCAGGDLKSISSEQRTGYQTRDRIRRMHLWFRELVNIEKPVIAAVDGPAFGAGRSEEHTSELQSLMRISYAVFCLKKKKEKRPQ